MEHIIAHSAKSSRFSLLPLWRHALGQLAAECVLCGGRTQGLRLCAGCSHDITLSMRASTPRCARCACRLSRDAPHCAHCMSRPRAFAATVAAFDYEPPAEVLLRLLKTELRINVADVLARLLLDALALAPPLPGGMLVIPIPASRASLVTRGFNPAGEIARALAGELGLPLLRSALRRTREDARQTSLGQRARIRGVHGLFQGAPLVAGRPIALVDDVMTTGSTMNAAAQALLAAGASSVTALVVARAP